MSFEKDFEATEKEAQEMRKKYAAEVEEQGKLTQKLINVCQKIMIEDTSMGMTMFSVAIDSLVKAAPYAVIVLLKHQLGMSTPTTSGMEQEVQDVIEHVREKMLQKKAAEKKEASDDKTKYIG